MTVEKEVESMNREEPLAAQVATPPATKTRGEVYGDIAYTFCKVATVVLITQRFALPVASGAASVFYVLAAVQGRKETHCAMKHHWWIAGLWGLVFAVSSFHILRPFWH